MDFYDYEVGAPERTTLGILNEKEDALKDLRIRRYDILKNKATIAMNFSIERKDREAMMSKIDEQVAILDESIKSLEAWIANFRRKSWLLTLDAGFSD